MQQQKVNWLTNAITDYLPRLKGTPEQVQIASKIRYKCLHRIWEERFHDTQNTFVDHCRKLPINAEWWIREKALHPTILGLLGLSYKTRKNLGYSCKYIKWLD